MSETSTLIGYSGRTIDCVKIKSALRSVFNSLGTDSSIENVCKSYPWLALLILDDNDPAWKAKGSWVWTHNPVYGTPFTKVFACGTIP